MGNTRYKIRKTSEEGEEALARARVARYWGTYQRVQELWRMGEKLSLKRWGKGQEAGSSEAEQEMRQLCQLLEAALVGFE